MPSSDEDQPPAPVQMVAKPANLLMASDPDGCEQLNVRVAPSTTKANRAANRPRRTTKPNPQVFGPDWQS